MANQCAPPTFEPVGVDVEFPRSGPLRDGVADRFFSGREVAALRSLPVDEQRAAFYRCWTRKEAFVKAKGKGLSYGLDQFTVSLLPGEPAALLETVAEPGEAARWRLHHLDPGPGYAGAVAVPAGVIRVRLWPLLMP
ncbi:MAG: 4'-phosphopantetheinyl transferase superfamily protein [bacterium]|nr:4'-phosphopantetheinyl transferase superfamily protein [bacterium]